MLKRYLNQEQLNDSGWDLGSAAEQQLLKKLHDTGIPLSEYVNGKI